MNSLNLDDWMEEIGRARPPDAARLLEEAFTTTAESSLGSLDRRAIGLLADRSSDGLLGHLSLEALGGLSSRVVSRLESAEPEPSRELQREAWELLDVLRRNTVLRRIADPGIVDEWANTILRLVESSHFTFGRLFQDRVSRYGGRTLFRLPGNGSKRTLSWRETAERVTEIERGLIALAREDETENRPVALLSENRLEVALLDLACLGGGIVNVMIPANATDKDVAYILGHAGVGTVIASTREQIQKVLLHRDNLPGLRRVISLDRIAASARDVLNFDELLKRAGQVPLSDVERRRDGNRIDDLATMMYTSGTTGMPKGIMFSQRNIVFKRFARALALPEIGEDDRFLCYLPLFHTFGRFLELAACIFWGSTYCFAENPAIDTLIRQMGETKPTVLISIPMKWMQLYERIRQEVDVELADNASIREGIGRVTGGRLRWGLSAAGYLDPDIFRFFQRQGIELMSGFGMTEATGGITMTPPGRYKEGSLGKALPGIELRFAEDGELKIRGPYVMMGYLDPPVEEPSFDEDGWLATGDIMEKDEDGFIRLVDRKKEIYKNIKGQTIAPQKIENLFRDFDSVGRIFLVGDHRHYNTALIYPNPELEELDFGTLTREEKKAHFRSLVVSANSFVEPFERIVDFAVIDRDFDAKQGELTPKGTFKRKVIEKNFKEVIELLYRRTTMTVGEVQVTVPNWLFQKLGITTSDLHVESDSLKLITTGTFLTLRKQSEDQVQVGSAFYRCSRDPIDLSVVLRTPSLWVGNDELVRFAPLELRHRDRRRQLTENIEWYRRTGLYEVTDEDRQAVEELLSKKELGLMDLHHVATFLEAMESADGILALRVLEHCLGLEDNKMTAVARRILRRARFSPHPEVLRRAFQILALFEQPRLYRSMLDTFLAGPGQVLDAETIAVLSEHDLAPERLDALMSVAEERALLLEPLLAVQETTKALFDFLCAYGCFHPSRYQELRGFLTRMSRDAGSTEVGKHAGRARRKLEQGFRLWLGSASRIAVDPETGLEYRWEDVAEFADDVDEEARKRLLTAFKLTPVLREAVFLFSGGATIRLEDILPNGVWARCIGTEHGKSVYRVAVRTRHQGQFDLAVNLNRELSPDEVEDEIDWLILCGESRNRGPLVESFGGYWPEHDLWTEEFISGETLDRSLRRLSRQKANDERYLGFWPYAAWSAASAHVDLWHRTRKALPSPKNVIVPMHDYHTGARLVSITGRRPFGSVYRLLVALEEELVRGVEKEHPRLVGLVGWDVVFSSVLEVVGEADGLDLLRDARDEAEVEGKTVMGEALERFVSSVEMRGFLPMRLFFAAKRYRRWARINSEATIPARASTHQEIYETYNLGRLQDAYPEVRARFFQETVFRESARSLAEGLGHIVQKLRSRDLVPDELSNAVADLRAPLKLDAEVDFFLTRLSYPYLRPEDEAEYVPAEAGGSQMSEMVVTLEDADGQPYRIRHALSPKEVGRLHGLFLAAKLPVQFRPDHRFLVAVNERGHLIGGLFYEVEPDGRTAHMDKIVVADRFQRKGVAGDILEELCNRLRTAGYRSLTTGFFRPQFFYRYGFTVERNYAGLVRSLEEQNSELRTQNPRME